MVQRACADLAHRVAEIADSGASQFATLYPDDMGLFQKIETVAKRIYRADEVLADKKIRDQLKAWEEDGYGHLPVCMAKTRYSFSTDPNLRGAPTRHLHAGSAALGGGWLHRRHRGEIMTMPACPGFRQLSRSCSAPRATSKGCSRPLLRLCALPGRVVSEGPRTVQCGSFFFSAEVASSATFGALNSAKAYVRE